MTHVFISYVRDDQEQVLRLARDLRYAGVNVWLDKERIKPGTRWQHAIREAIANGAFFVACFSEAYLRRNRTYMNEELVCAIDELRQRSADRAWFIPVRLGDVPIPNRRIGAGESLRDIQWVDLFRDWREGVLQIVDVIRAEDSPADRRYGHLARRVLGYASLRDTTGMSAFAARDVVSDWNEAQQLLASSRASERGLLHKYVRNLPRTWIDDDPDQRQHPTPQSAYGAIMPAADGEPAFVIDLAAVEVLAEYAVQRGWLFKQTGGAYVLTDRGRAEFELTRSELELNLEYA